MTMSNYMTPGSALTPDKLRNAIETLRAREIAHTKMNVGSMAKFHLWCTRNEITQSPGELGGLTAQNRSFDGIEVTCVEALPHNIAMLVIDGVIKSVIDLDKQHD